MASFNPKVSIIIPVYNGSNFLREAIDSALAQTYSNIEVIVINDGSKDNTEEIALSYGNKIRYFTKPNGGVSTALNLGISEMKGDYFSWLSHDDLYLENKVKSQIQFISKLENKECSIVYGNWHYIDQNGNKLKEVNLSEDKNNLLLSLLISAPLHGCTVLIPKKCFEIEGLFKTKLKNTQDVDLFYRFAQKFDFHLLQNNMVAGRIHGNQTTHTTNKRHIQESNQFLINSLKEVGIEDLSINTNKEPKEIKSVLLMNWSNRGYKRASQYLLSTYDYSSKEILKSNYNLIYKLFKRRINNLKIKLT
ncbi:glycosyltransferase [Winogradskyella sp.]|uniref:glycosyltransferase n=1 Tax=Winogradskyella sp. TaxID=1883156 RepID=UPI003BA92CA1